MSSAIALYPVLTEELLRKIGLQVMEYEFKYDFNHQQRSLVAKPLQGFENNHTRLYISDESGEWDPNQFNFKFERTLLISNPYYLFGEQGIAVRDAELGIAVKWTSKPSKQRGVFIGSSISLEKSEKDVLVSINGEFSPGTLREHFDLTTILYLKKPGNPNHAEKHLANIAGIELGVLDSFTYYLSGQGSFFPVFSIQDAGPLWRAECNWQDPRVDPFDDTSFRILLNENHPHYKHIHSASGNSVTPLLKEIVFFAIQILIENVLKDVPYDEVINGTNADSGSICQAVKYFIDTFDLETSTKEGLAFTLRKNMDDKFGAMDA